MEEEIYRLRVILGGMMGPQAEDSAERHDSRLVEAGGVEPPSEESYE